MNKETIEEYNKLKEKLRLLKENINNEFTNFIGIRATLSVRSIDRIKLEQELLSISMFYIKKKIFILERMNSNDDNKKNELIDEIFIEIYDNDGRYLDSYTKSDAASLKKIKLIDEINEKSRERETKIQRHILMRDYCSMQHLINDYNLYPYGISLNNNYQAVQSLLNIIQKNSLNDNELSNKIINYNNALKCVDGSEKRLPEVVNLIINDFKGKGSVDLLVEIPKIIETLETTPKIKSKRPNITKEM